MTKHSQLTSNSYLLSVKLRNWVKPAELLALSCLKSPLFCIISAEPHHLG